MRSVEKEINRLESDRCSSRCVAVSDLRERYLLLLRAEGTPAERKTRAALAADLRRVGARADRWCVTLAAAAALIPPTTLAGLGGDPAAVWLVTGISPVFAWMLSRRTLRWSTWRRDAAAFRLDAGLPTRA